MTRNKNHKLSLKIDIYTLDINVKDLNAWKWLHMVAPKNSQLTTSRVIMTFTSLILVACKWQIRWLGLKQLLEMNGTSCIERTIMKLSKKNQTFEKRSL
jgi:hypothetical protein